MFRLFIEKDFESKQGKKGTEREKKRCRIIYVDYIN